MSSKTKAKNYSIVVSINVTSENTIDWVIADVEEQLLGVPGLVSTSIEGASDE